MTAPLSPEEHGCDAAALSARHSAAELPQTHHGELLDVPGGEVGGGTSQAEAGR